MTWTSAVVDVVAQWRILPSNNEGTVAGVGVMVTSCRGVVTVIFAFFLPLVGAIIGSGAMASLGDITLCGSSTSAEGVTAALFNLLLPFEEADTMRGSS